jgi:hypothetical protein
VTTFVVVIAALIAIAFSERISGVWIAILVMWCAVLWRILMRR